ncbi:MarR family transcriptional regulator [Demequina rhizosphaerae]|uniref:MarR family transcriptional regulator n=1 Tax=Demequina rhizosphaerae TaxID=1638985 RepID=UPI0007825113|nr:MarR family transcriptional regulator [Demequina rhizosphaerae]
MNPPRPTELAESWRLVDCISDYAAAFTSVLDTSFGTDYIDDGQVLALETLRLRGPSRVAEIEASTQLEPDAVLRFMRELRGRRLVESSRAAVDRRQRAYHLTDAGWAAVRRTASDLEAFFADYAPLAGEVVRLTEAQAPARTAVEPPPADDPDPWTVAAGISRTGQQLSRAIVARLGAERESKVQGRRIIAMIAICSQGEMRPSALAEELGLSAAGATYLIDVLERHGLVTRERSLAGDRRTKRVVATTEGLAAAVAVHDALQDIAPVLHAQFARLGAFARPARAADAGPLPPAR